MDSASVGSKFFQEDQRTQQVRDTRFAQMEAHSGIRTQALEPQNCMMGIAQQVNSLLPLAKVLAITSARRQLFTTKSKSSSGAYYPLVRLKLRGHSPPGMIAAQLRTRLLNKKEKTRKSSPPIVRQVHQVRRDILEQVKRSPRVKPDGISLSLWRDLLRECST